MTIGSATVASSGSSTNGATTTFSFSFSIADYGATEAEDLIQVILQTTATGAETVLTRGTSAGQYSVSINGDQSASPGGTITTVSTYATGYKIWIRLAPTSTQETDLANQSAFNASVIEAQFDDIQRKINTLNDIVRRAPYLSTPAGASFNGKITGPFTAGYGLKIKADGTGFDLGALTSATVGASMAALVASGVITVDGATAALDFFEREGWLGYWLEDFGAVGDGSTDDKSAINAWLAAVAASPSRLGYIQCKTYACVGALNTIATGGIRIVAVGPSSSHDVGSAFGAIIKATGATTGHTMLTVAPTDGASAQQIDAIYLDGVTFDCNGKAAKGVIWKARGGLLNISVLSATGTGLEFDVPATLGEARDTQRTKVRFVGRQLEADGVALRLKGDASANSSFLQFELVDIAHKNATGIIIENGDNLVFSDVRVAFAAGGSATYSVEFRGGATEAQSARAIDMVLSATKAAYIGGFTSYTVPSYNIHLFIDDANGTPAPVVEAGATCIVSSYNGDDYYGLTRYNLALNGDMALNQLAPSTNADKSAGFDGGVVLTQSNPVALTSVSTPENGQAQCMRMTQANASAQRMGYLWVIPSDDSIPLRGKAVALAMRIRQSTSADVRCAILEWTGTADAVAGDIVADWTSTTYTTAGFFESTTKNLLAIMETAATANTWRNLSGPVSRGGLTANVGSSCNNLLVFVWTEATVAQNVTLDIGQVRLIPGFMPDATVYEPRAQQIARARRQVEKSYSIGVAPATSSQLGAVLSASRAAVGDQLDRWHVRFAVPKIALPTVTVYSTTGASGKTRNITDGNDINATAGDIGDSGFSIAPTANTTAEKVYGTHFVAQALPWS